MTLLEALIIQFQFALIMIPLVFLFAKARNTKIECPLDDNSKIFVFGMLFVFWFGVMTWYRYVLQLPLIGLWGYLW